MPVNPNLMAGTRCTLFFTQVPKRLTKGLFPLYAEFWLVALSCALQGIVVNGHT